MDRDAASDLGVRMRAGGEGCAFCQLNGAALKVRAPPCKLKSPPLRLPLPPPPAPVLRSHVGSTVIDVRVVVCVSAAVY
eukprot:5183972-Pyramimonas_sp.AAC.1